MDIISYTKKRKKIKNIADEDYAILAMLTYCNFHLIKKKRPLLLKSIKNNEVIKVTEAICAEDNARQLLTSVIENKNFRKLKILSIEHNIDAESIKQFYAITYKINRKEIAVVFRGTDGTIIGWKENLSLSYLTHVPAQDDALAYLNKCVKKYKRKNIVVTGHSKGGNLAEYSYLKCHNQKPIKRVISFDGPSNVDDSLYKNSDTVNKIIKYVPYESLIGILFNKVNTVVVSSEGKKLQQHLIYNWDIDNYSYRFVDLPDRSRFSIAVGKSFHEWISEVTYDSREDLVEQISALLKFEIDRDNEATHINPPSIPGLITNLLRPKNVELLTAAIKLVKLYMKYKREF